jgi:hypothetical protein
MSILIMPEEQIAVFLGGDLYVPRETLEQSSKADSIQYIPGMHLP